MVRGPFDAAPPANARANVAPCDRLRLHSAAAPALFLKPVVTRKAAEHYGHQLAYRSRPQWEVYSAVLAFARRVRVDLRDLRPRDMIDLQSFLWVLGSDEYPD